MINDIFKYPRTQHIEGSRCQIGDEDLDSIPFSKIKDKFIVVEEKVDGANSGISFSEEGELLLQSRGHYLTGGPREKHFDLFKTWANMHVGEFFNILSTRYIMYGEWLYAKHTVFYDELSHYFMEFDIYDKFEKKFLSTKARREMLEGCSFITSVLVLFEGRIKSHKDLIRFIDKSNFISSNQLESLKKICFDKGLSLDQVLKETDCSSMMEGLYIKVEENDVVMERYKYVRSSFLTNVTNSESHWLDRPIVPNKLKAGVDIFK